MVPVIAGLLAAGVPVAPVMAFWIASPWMNPQAFVLTSAVFDFDFAMARLISAIVLGAMPFVLFLFLYLSNRQYLEPLFESTPGLIAMGGAVFLLIAGVSWLNKIVKIDV